LCVAERPPRNEQRQYRPDDGDFHACQDESGEEQHQQIALTCCCVDSDGLRAHWLSTILQDCVVASNPTFFAVLLCLRKM
jgi:hypothetical protein